MKRIKLVQTIPGISYFDIILKGVEMNGKVSEEEIVFHCDARTGEIHQAIDVEDKKFIIGKFFFGEHFTKKEVKRLEGLCKKEVERVKERMRDMEF